MTTAIKINQNDGKQINVMVGGETEVDFDFPIFAATHIDIYETDLTGAITLLVKDTDYTVPAGSVNQQAGGTVDLDATQYPSGATAGHIFTAIQAAPEERITDFTQAGDYFADTLNKELDLITQQIQQMRRDLTRAPLAPIDTTLTSLTLPDPTDDASLAWDGTSGAIKNGPTTSTISGAATSAAAAASSASAAASSASGASSSASAAAASAASAQAAVDSAPFRDVVFLTNADSPYTVTSSQNGVFFAIDTSGGAVTVNLPEISTLSMPFNVTFKKETGDANQVTVNRGGASDLIDTATSKSQGSVGGFTLVADTDPTPDKWTSQAFGASAGNMTVDPFVAGVDFTAGSSTQITLSTAPGSENNVWIYFDGVYQEKSEYTVSTTTVTFSSAIPSGVTSIDAVYGTTLAIGTPADETVDLDQLAAATQGDILYWGGSGQPARLTAGTSGQVLQTGGAGANPSWQDAAGGAFELLASYSASADANIEFGSGLDVNGAIDSTYDEYLLIGISVIPATDGTDCYFTLSDDTGSTYRTAYELIRYGTQSTASTHTFGNSNGASQIDMTVFGIGNLANQEGANFIAHLTDPANSAIYTMLEGRCWQNTNTSQMAHSVFCGQNDESLAIDAAKFQFSSGNTTSGEFYLLGRKKS